MVPENPSADVTSRDDRLESWKEIAAYFGRGVSTVQRWEKEENLPVYRHVHGALGSVYAYKSELDLWRRNRKPRSFSGGKSMAPQPSVPKIGLARRWLVGAAAVVLIGLALLVQGLRSSVPVLLASPVPLTSLPGSETAPSFSPDGKEVIFTWNGESGNNTDVYRVPVAGGPLVRLTNDSHHKQCPKWSPDGRQIAFLRPSATSLEAVVIPSAGGTERVFTLRRAAGIADEMVHLAWTADAKSLVVPESDSSRQTVSLFLMPLDGTQRRRLTQPPDGIPGDLQPALSPDGKWLAFVRYRSGSEADVYLSPAAGGVPRRLTNDNCYFRGLDWATDTGRVIFSSNRTSGAYSLWSISIKGGSPLPVARAEPGNAILPAVSRGGRVAYEFELRDVNIWRWDNPGRPGTGPMPVARSTWNERLPTFSPDGKKIAFCSNRSGQYEIWVANADGSDPLQWTHMRGPYTDSPAWSPDGQNIAFTSHTFGNRDIYVCGADGAVRRLTSDPSEEGRPSWSRDSRWVYFRSDRSGTTQIWKTPADGSGSAVQVTHNGGYDAAESPDGNLLYFVRDPAHSGLWSIPVGGGNEQFVIPSVRTWHWAVANRGIFFLDRAAPRQGATVACYRFDTRQVDIIATLTGKLWSGFSVRSDGNSILWTQQDLNTSDLMLLQPFGPSR